MAIEPQTTTSIPKGPVIENEFPNYRAISATAVFSMLAGVAAVLTFAEPWFACLGVVAIVLGVIAQRKIKRYPDMLTGKGLAQAGIALGLIFTLSALTFGFVQTLKIRQSASQFAGRYAEILAKDDLADAHWYRMQPAARKGTTPKAQLDQMTKTGADPSAYFAEVGPLKAIKDSLKGDQADVHFVDLEDYGFEQLTPFALAVVEVHGTDDKGKAKEDFALLELRSDPESPGFNWWISQVKYPYTRKSHKLKPAPLDDGHGHDGSGHAH